MLVLLGGLAVFTVTGLPIAYGLGLSAVLYFLAYHPELLLVIPQRVYAGLESNYHRQSRWLERCEPLKAVGKPTAT
jgi:hypothetical protein